MCKCIIQDIKFELKLFDINQILQQSNTSLKVVIQIKMQLNVLIQINYYLKHLN